MQKRAELTKKLGRTYAHWNFLNTQYFFIFFSKLYDFNEFVIKKNYLELKIIEIVLEVSIKSFKLRIYYNYSIKYWAYDFYYPFSPILDFKYNLKFRLKFVFMEIKHDVI